MCVFKCECAFRVRDFSLYVYYTCLKTKGIRESLHRILKLLRLLLNHVRGFTPPSQPRLPRISVRCICACVLHVGMRAGALFLYAALFPSVFTTDCICPLVRWVCVEFMRPFDRKLWSQLSFRPLAISPTRSFLRLCPFGALRNLSFSRLKGDSTSSRGEEEGNSPPKFVKTVIVCRLFPLSVFV